MSPFGGNLDTPTKASWRVFLALGQSVFVSANLVETKTLAKTLT
jgi:hypothetical protein